MYSMFPQYQTMPTIPQMPQLQQQTIQYVNGKQSAESYQMPANSSVILMDSNTNKFYLKQTDASGIATIRTYDFRESKDDKPAEYVTKSEFEQFKAKLKGGRNESFNDVKQQQ